VNTVSAFKKDYKSKPIYNDIYFVREKGGSSKESIVYQREIVERRSGEESGTIPSLTSSSSNKSREDA